MSDLTPEELELAALSAIYTGDALLYAVAAGVDELAFQVPEHAAAWAYLVRRLAAGKTVDRGDVAAASGAELRSGVTDYEMFVDQLVERSLARRARQAIRDRLDEVEATPRSGLSALLGDLGAIAAVGTGGHRVRFERTGPERLERLRERATRRAAGETVGISTGLPIFDRIGDSWKPGEVVTVIGATNVGKSFLALWLASHAYLEGMPVLYLSPESTVEDIDNRLDPLLAHRLGFRVSNRGLRNGTQDAGVYAAYLEVLAATDTAWVTLDVGDHGAFTATDVVAEARRHRPKVLVIDGFHLISGEGKTWESMQAAAKAVKGVAQELGLVVMAVSQAQRSATLAADDTPELGQAAYGLGLIEASNRVLSLAEVRGDPGRRILKVPKNRDGERVTKRQYLRFDVDVGDIELLVPDERDDGIVEL